MSKKWTTVVAQSTCPSQNVQSTPCSDHFWKLTCRKCARRFVARSTFPIQKCAKAPHIWDHFWTFRCRFAWQAQGIVHLVKSKQNVAKREGFDSSFKYNHQHPTLHYTTLRSAPLHYTSLHYTPVYYTTLHHTPLHYTTLHLTALHYTTLCTILPYATLHYTTPHFDHSTPHHTTPHHTTLHYTQLQFTTTITTTTTSQLHYKNATLHSHYNYTTTTTTTLQLPTTTTTTTTTSLYTTLH